MSTLPVVECIYCHSPNLSWQYHLGCRWYSCRSCEEVWSTPVVTG